MQAFLAVSEAIDHDEGGIRALARRLRGDSAEETARAAFAFVRDEIQHSGDHERSPTTWRASEVLRRGHGYCYAKSHLLVAILRANDIPAGICHQRLMTGPDAYALHALVAAHLPGIGWYRMDARGNKPGVDADFAPPIERLAFRATGPGEWDDPTPFAEPWPEVLACLRAHPSWEGVAEHLPDRATPPIAPREPPG